MDKPLSPLDLALSIVGSVNLYDMEKKSRKGKGVPDKQGKKQKRNKGCCCGSGKKAKDCCVYFPDGMGGL
jgi:uncharacterized protein YecA (UPF0149 family)